MEPAPEEPEPENRFEGMDQDEMDSESVDSPTELRKAVGDHVAMWNKLIDVARRMKVNARNKGFQD